MKDESLEKLSDKVRMGEPIEISEALEVIEYQNRKKSLWDRITEWWRFK